LLIEGSLGGMAETTAVEDQEAVTGRQILPLVEHLARVGRRSADGIMSGCLRPRHLIALKVLGEQGPMAQHAIGTALSLDPSNVVGLLNELEERGLISRRRDPADRRRHIVELSAAGSDELVQTYGKLDRVEDDLFSVLTGEERATLHALLSRTVAGLAAVCGPKPCLAAEPEDCAEVKGGTLSG
jgi:DNA-binding MarR family transcriptional regulator